MTKARIVHLMMLSALIGAGDTLLWVFTPGTDAFPAIVAAHGLVGFLAAVFISFYIWE